MKTRRLVSFIVMVMVVLLMTYALAGILMPNVFEELLTSDTGDISEIGTVTKEELATLPIEKALLYEEMQQHMKDKGYSSEQIGNFDLNHKNDNFEGSNNIVKYTILRLDGWSYSGTVNEDPVNYSIIPELIVGLEYYRNSSSPERIVSIEAPTFDSSGGDDCSFDGLFDFKLVSGNEIFTALRGYLYDGGNIDWEFGSITEIEKEDMVKLKLSGRYRDDVMYVSHPETYYSSDMCP